MVDIIIVQKQSNELSHERAREHLLSYLEKQKVSFEIFTLEQIYQKKLPYYHPAIPSLGFHPQKKLVLALGGDGTLLHASHYVGGDVRLLGINSSPETSVGHMCFLKPVDIEQQLGSLLNDENNFKHIERLQICFKKSDYISHTNSPCDPTHSDFKVLPLCLNDALICHEHPAGTTRVQMTLYDRQEQKVDFSHKVFSSGLWVSTVMGQTAAISSYGFQKEPKDSDSVFVVVREPYYPKNLEHYPKMFQFHNQKKQLRVLSQMRGEGLICVDGPDSCTHFQDGDTVIFNAPEEALLKLVL